MATGMRDAATAFRRTCLVANPQSPTTPSEFLKNASQGSTLGGATLLSASDSVAQDELGLKTAAQLGKHVAEVAMKLARSGA